MSENDIIDRIDALIDEQLDAGEPIGGYDYGDPEYPKCDRCRRKWHGLPFSDCLGSAVEGPMPPETNRSFASGGLIQTAPLETTLPTDDVFDPTAWRDINFGFVQPHRFSPWQELLFRQVLEFAELSMESVRQGLSGMAAHLNVEPDTRTPQQRALPRPSTTPPMWAHDPTRSRRPRRHRNQPNRQGTR